MTGALPPTSRGWQGLGDQAIDVEVRHVHEFMTLDEVIDAPTCTFEPAWSTRTVEDDDPGEGVPCRKLSLAASETYEKGVVYLSYGTQS